ncbi:MAG: ComEC/Rec2 family competence protein, partial [Pyrinomonadaceae bacterium]
MLKQLFACHTKNVDQVQEPILGPSSLGIMQPEPIFSTAPLLYVTLAVILGILISTFHPFPLYLSLFLSLVSGCCSLLMWRRQEHLLTIFCMLLGFVFFGVGLASTGRESNSSNKALFEPYYSETVELTGRISEAIESSPDGRYIVLDLEHTNFDNHERTVSGKVSLFLPLRSSEENSAFEKSGLQYSSRIKVSAKISRVERYRNPGVRSFGEYLEQRNLSATGIIKSPEQISVLEKASRLNPLVRVFAWRAQLTEQLNKQFKQQTAAVLIASLVGNRHYLSRQTSERFR